MSKQETKFEFCTHEQHGGVCKLTGEYCSLGPCPNEDIEEFVPVRHGRWKYNTDFQVWNCSECGENPHKGTGVVAAAEKLPAYCPHCGAIMDGAE